MRLGDGRPAAEQGASTHQARNFIVAGVLFMKSSITRYATVRQQPCRLLGLTRCGRASQFGDEFLETRIVAKTPQVIGGH
jgi:hypothetical protein